MKDAFGRADGQVLANVERAALTGRRITARRARKQKRRAQHSARALSVGPLTFTPIALVAVSVVLLAGVAGAAAMLGGGGNSKKAGSVVTLPSGAPTTNAPTTNAPTTATGLTNGIYVRFADAVNTVHYMYCTAAGGCSLVDVAQNGSSTVAAALTGGVWHTEERKVIQHDPCINTVQNGQRVGKPGDLVVTDTVNLRPAGTQRFGGIAVPARITGTIARIYDAPEQPGCTFGGFTDSTLPVDSPVTVFQPRQTAVGSG